jgi:hypothetical protein
MLEIYLVKKAYREVCMGVFNDVRLKHSCGFWDSVNGNIDILVLHGVRQSAIANPILTSGVISHGLGGKD